jgi:hypothetical protein
VAAVLSNFPHQLPEGRSSPSNEGTHFTCFTGTKVQILSLVALQMKAWCRLSLTCCRFFCFFYWYKRTNTDAGGASHEGMVSAVANLLSILVSMAQEAKPVLSLLALLVQKGRYKSAVDSCVRAGTKVLSIHVSMAQEAKPALSLLALLVQKYKC